jgi:ribosomal protein L11 methylase PrmA
VPDQYKEVPGSFRDPSGFVFRKEGSLYRQVNRVYQEDFDLLVDSGLCQNLVQSSLLIPHTDAGLEYAVTAHAYKVIEPREIPFVSHPYEWCFSQLKDAALLTLEIQARAFEHGMSLKDCSAYNIQFVGGKPLFIDTLSFEKYREGQPWVAYRQFCQHFLAPLALMSHVDVRLHQLLRVYLDGVPLDLASKLLPTRTRASFGLLSHIHLHAKAQERYADSSISATSRKVGRTSFLGLVDSLKSTVEKLGWQPGGTEWYDYYDITNYSEPAFERKQQVVAEMLDQVRPSPSIVWDLGANTGLFSRIASDRGIPTISFDIDPAAVEMNYLESKDKAEASILPLVLDLTNPSPGIGWDNRERMSLTERGPADLALALALIHHLAISNNLPFSKIAKFFGQTCHTLIIEFVPKSDSQVQKLLSSREDIFSEYDQQSFEEAFTAFFTIQRCEPIEGTQRTLYLMTAQASPG